MNESNKVDRQNRDLVLRLLGLAAGMFAFGFLLVPLYDIFCDITGVGGKLANEAAAVTETVDESRLVTVEFLAAVNSQAPWDFRPVVTSMQVHPGKLYDATYIARNLTSRSIVGQAVPNVAPGEAARYFRKTECFCFTSQTFAAEESKEMPVQFILDPDLPDYVDRVTLSYTFFVSQQAAADQSTLF